MLDGCAIGSSSCQIIRGSASKNSRGDDDDFVMLGLEALRDEPRVLSSFASRSAKATENVRTGSSIMARHHGGDRRGVDAAREEDAERDVGHQAHAHRVAEAFVVLGDDRASSARVLAARGRGSGPSSARS